MRVNRYAALWGLLHVVGGSADGSPASLPSYTAKTYTISEGTPMAFDEGTVIKLSSDGTSPSIVVLDYGRNVEGYATFNVSKRSGDTSAFEMTYSETRALLDSDMVSNLW